MYISSQFEFCGWWCGCMLDDKAQASSLLLKSEGSLGITVSEAWRIILPLGKGMLGSVCCKASTHCGTIRQATIRELVEDSEDTYFGLGRKDAAHGNAFSPWHFCLIKDKHTNDAGWGSGLRWVCRRLSKDGLASSLRICHTWHTWSSCAFVRSTSCWSWKPERGSVLYAPWKCCSDFCFEILLIHVSIYRYNI